MTEATCLTLADLFVVLPELGSCTKYGDSFTELFMNISQSSSTAPVVMSCWSTAVIHSKTTGLMQQQHKHM